MEKVMFPGPSPREIDQISVGIRNPGFISQRKVQVDQVFGRRTFQEAFNFDHQLTSNEIFADEKSKASLSRACETQTLKRQHLEKRLEGKGFDERGKVD